ncbi:MAG: GxxExxY protein [Pyrinomonadaceae bacterium]
MFFGEFFARETGEKDMGEILYKEESYKIVGACFEVYKNKGCGFTEPVYQECLAMEFNLQRIPFVAQPVLSLEYKGVELTQTFRPDFICFGKVIVELKALERLADVHRAQTLNYLNATGFELALLVNFGHFPKIGCERIANTINRGTRPSVYSRLAAKDNT